MQEQDFSRLIKLASSTEKTPELQAYWQKQYSIILNDGLFILSAKTLESFKEDRILTSPATPLGEIVLMKRFNEKEFILDEEDLKNTVFASVRFLDSLISRINFNQETRFIVEQYRKIGLGVADFSEYLKKVGSETRTEEIDFVGNLISESAYRASETLAEEKGFCGSWDKIKKHLRPKSFERWYNIETEEIKDGLELYETMDQEQIDISEYEIVPRRNSHLLVFPPDQPWQIWSDRDSHAPKTEIITLDEQIKKELTVKDISKAEDGFELPSKEEDSSQEPEFTAGELVVIVEESSPFKGGVYQVLEHSEINGKYYYYLEGDKKIAKIKWSEENLKPVDLIQILEKINRDEPIEIGPSDNLFAIRASVLIFNKDKDKVLLENSDLPYINATKKDRPEFMLSDDLKERWGISVDIIDEIGTTTNQDGVLYLVFEGVVESPLKPVLKSKKHNLKWVSLEGEKVVDHIRLAFDKYIYKKMM